MKDQSAEFSFLIYFQPPVLVIFDPRIRILKIGVNWILVPNTVSATTTTTTTTAAAAATNNNTTNV